jgi:predicted RecB family nuclease
LSLKKIEKVYGRSHKGNVATASDSIIQYEHVIKLREENNHEEADRILQNIYDYNEVDCQSTKELDDWLRKVAADNKITVGQLRQSEIFEEDYLEDLEDPDY